MEKSVECRKYSGWLRVLPVCDLKEGEQESLPWITWWMVWSCGLSSSEKWRAVCVVEMVERVTLLARHVMQWDV